MGLPTCRDDGILGARTRKPVVTGAGKGVSSGVFRLGAALVGGARTLRLGSRTAVAPDRGAEKGQRRSMKLTVREISEMFDVPERTVERWIREDGMPGLKVHGQYRFHRAELLEWAHHRGIRIVADPAASQFPEHPAPTFAAALERGGIHRDLVAADRESTLRALIECLPIGAEVDRELIFEVFLARENAGSTGVGDGIAIPHVRNPIVLDVDAPAVSLCFLRSPIDFGAIDGKPVHTLFAIVAPTAREHLHLLGRLASVLHDPAFHGALLAREGAGRLLELARAAEERLAVSTRAASAARAARAARAGEDPVGDHEAAAAEVVRAREPLDAALEAAQADEGDARDADDEPDVGEVGA